MRNRTRAFAVIVAVLLIGCVLGIAGYHIYERRSQRNPTSTTTGHAPGHTGRLADRLQLTKEQEQQLNKILEESRQQIEIGRRELDSKLQAIRIKTNERIASILNEEQRKSFQQLLGETGSHGSAGDQNRGHGHH
jgi:Spy/CpxP family protein refolding chaperone